MHMPQPAGYNATRRAVLPTADFIGPLDPSKERIGLGPVSYYCYYSLLLSAWFAVFVRCNRHSSAVLLLCCPPAIDISSSSKAAAKFCTT